VEVRSGILTTEAQRGLLAKALKERNFEKLGAAEYNAHRAPFRQQPFKDRLIADWEKQTGRQWPTYSEPILDKKGGIFKKIGDRHDAHHIIPQQVGGPNEWWNMHPLSTGPNHQGGVHGSGAPLSRILSTGEQ
jgi:predicted ribonuclease toxin of YeeF-YezG toxin-antitoxin module